MAEFPAPEEGIVLTLSSSPATSSARAASIERVGRARPSGEGSRPSCSSPTAGSSSTWRRPDRRQADGHARDPTGPEPDSSFLNIGVADIDAVHPNGARRCGVPHAAAGPRR